MVSYAWCLYYIVLNVLRIYVGVKFVIDLLLNVPFENLFIWNSHSLKAKKMYLDLFFRLISVGQGGIMQMSSLPWQVFFNGVIPIPI